ncbi:YdcF family protein [Marivibrio halodurans]|uniref:YdcF family protein n=1 Tax=Marivibrio halodurans TaxID=2039722 RepID=A0A8J7S816_9PROT|nr:ElyC/SanA/YdcF family protein [Marivibrio halodurans]MBP5857182.1 YdcF family protein [Marivibrio halodurans]
MDGTTYDLFRRILLTATHSVPLWIVLGAALLLWWRARRRRGMSLVAVLGLGAAALTLGAMPAGPKLAERVLAPSDLPVLGESGAIPAGIGQGVSDGPFIAIFSGGIVRYGADETVGTGEAAGWFPKPVTLRRVGRAMAVARARSLPVMLSGGRVPAEAPPESEVIARAMRLEDTVLLERRSRNTYENARELAALAARRGWRRVIVATDRVHLRRAAACLRAAGLVPVAVIPAEAPVDLGPGDLIPSVEGLADWRPVLREILGLVYYLARGRIAPRDL